MEHKQVQNFQPNNYTFSVGNASTAQFKDNRPDSLKKEALVKSIETSTAVDSFVDNRPESIAQMKMIQHIDTAPIQKMSIEGVKSPSVVSGATRKKHVAAEGDHISSATAGYGNRTFVTADSILTTAVDAHAKDFKNNEKGRFDFNATLPIYQYEKTEAPPEGFAKGKPVKQTLKGVASNTEIGVKKGGDGILKVSHFKKI